jgi:molybdopterin adenylyltransferase
MKARLRSINISEKSGTIKTPIDEAELTLHGIKQDAHARDWHRMISLLAREDAAGFEETLGRPVADGEFAENLTLDGLDLDKLAVLDRITVGDTELEITQIGKKCHGDACAIFQEVGKCVMPKKGLFARVITPGTIRTNDPVEWLPRPLRISVITLSDRAAKGEYKDLSGPRILTMLKEHFGQTRWHLETDQLLIPDDKEVLETALLERRDQGVDIILTTGGTGVGPRDIAPDVVLKTADRIIPGVMEHIRLKHADRIPSAVLSRSVAALLGDTAVYTLPGSVKAVNEYMEEILKSMEHLIKILHGLGH